MISGRLLTEKLRLTGGNVDWQRLSFGLLERPIRFIVPVAVIALIQWQLASNGYLVASQTVAVTLFHNNSLAVNLPLSSTMTNVVPQWGLVTNLYDWTVLVINLMTIDNPFTPGLNFQRSSMLWTVTWSYFGSLFVYTMFIITSFLPSSRVVVYLVAGYFSWATYTYNLVFLVGLAICDFCHTQTFAKIRASRYNIVMQLTLLLIALLVLWVQPLNTALQTAFSFVQHLKERDELTGPNILASACLILALELNSLVQSVMGIPAFHMLGRISIGMFTLHPSFLYGIFAQNAIGWAASGASEGYINGLGIGVLYPYTLLASLLLAVFVEWPVWVASRSLWRILTFKSMKT